MQILNSDKDLQSNDQDGQRMNKLLLSLRVLLKKARAAITMHEASLDPDPLEKAGEALQLNVTTITEAMKARGDWARGVDDFQLMVMRAKIIIKNDSCTEAVVQLSPLGRNDAYQLECLTNNLNKIADKAETEKKLEPSLLGISYVLKGSTFSSEEDVSEVRFVHGRSIAPQRMEGGESSTCWQRNRVAPCGMTIKRVEGVCRP